VWVSMEYAGGRRRKWAASNQEATITFYGKIKRIVDSTECSSTQAIRRGPGQSWRKAMNVLQMIKQQHSRKQRLSKAQFLMSKTYRGTDYTSAHQAPVLDSHPSLCYRGQGYIK
jgi:hypothetical protein